MKEAINQIKKRRIKRVSFYFVKFFVVMLNVSVEMNGFFVRWLILLLVFAALCQKSLRFLAFVAYFCFL